MKWLGSLAAVAALVAALAPAAEPRRKDGDDFVRPFPIVAVPAGATAAHKAQAKIVADAMDVRVVSEMKTNPVCCVWVDITGWTPNPGEPGYVIINQSGGSIISASNEDQLRAAVERFRKTGRKKGKEFEVPLGLLTSYRIAAAATR